MSNKMKFLLSNHDLKMMTFLEELNRNRSNISIRNLSIKLNIPIRTISSYIIEFNDYNLDTKIISTNRGITLEIPNNKSFRCVYKEIYNRSLELSIIQQIFFDGGQSSEDLSDAFFTSLSTIKRSINRVNRILKPDNLSITSGKNILSGNEKKIRQFLSCFYGEKYSDLEFLTGEEAYTLRTLVIKLFQELGVKIYRNQITKYMRWMYINSIRIKYGHRVQLKMTKFNSCSLIENKEFCKQFYFLFGIPLNLENINDMLYPVNNNLYFYSNNQMFKRLECDPVLQNTYLRIEQVLEDIAVKLDICLPISTKEMLLRDFMNVLNLRNYYTFILYNRREIFLKHLSAKYPAVRNFFTPYLLKLSETPLSVDEQQELLYILLTHWYELYDQLSKIEKCVNVYIHVDTDLEHALFIKKEIQQYCRYNIKCHVMMDAEELIIEKSSILVTTLTNVDDYIHNVICFSDYFSDRNWKNLNFLIQKIASE